MELRLPPGYYLELDADVVVLYEGKGRCVAVFSARGLNWETVERRARRDHFGRKILGLTTSRLRERA